MKRIKVLLTKDEVDLLVNDILGGAFMRLGDDGEMESKYAKRLVKIEKKIVKGFNKIGHYYLWQLKDRDAEITDDNIRDEWK